MSFVPPYIISLVIGYGALDRTRPIADVSLSNVLDLASLAVIFAGVFIVARYRAALDVSEATAAAWQSERDAEKSRAERLTADLASAQARVAALEAQPNLNKMEHLLGQMVDVARQHENNAQQRHGNIIEAIRDTR